MLYISDRGLGGSELGHCGSDMDLHGSDVGHCGSDEHIYDLMFVYVILMFRSLWVFMGLYDMVFMSLM